MKIAEKKQDAVKCLVLQVNIKTEADGTRPCPCRSPCLNAGMALRRITAGAAGRRRLASRRAFLYHCGIGCIQTNAAGNCQ